MTPPITVVGSIMMDLTIHVPAFPEPGEAVHGRDFRTACGGKGANQAYAISRMGGRAALIGCVGADVFGDALLANLNAAGVDTSPVIRRPEVATGVALIAIGPNGQNEILVANGVNGTLSADDVARQSGLLRSSRAVVAQLETTIPAVQTALHIARQAGVMTVFNPAPHFDFPLQVLRECDFVIPNEIEATRLTGVRVQDTASAAQAALALKQMGARNVLVTLGAQGVWLDTGEWLGHLPTFPVQAVDTVGAGDTFIGVFTARLCEGAGIREAAHFASAAAAISVTRHGAQPGVPSRDEVERLAATRPEK